MFKVPQYYLFVYSSSSFFCKFSFDFGTIFMRAFNCRSNQEGRKRKNLNSDHDHSPKKVFLIYLPM